MISKLYDDCGKGQGLINKNGLQMILSKSTTLSSDTIAEIFDIVDDQCEGYVTIGERKILSKSTWEFNNSFQLTRSFAENVLRHMETRPECETIFERPPHTGLIDKKPKKQ